MIEPVYITRIHNEDKKYGFGVTRSDKQVYIPGNIVDLFELESSDVGTRNEMALDEDKSGKTDYVALTLIDEDSALRQAYEWQKEEIERLEGILDDHGIGY